jgi:integrase
MLNWCVRVGILANNPIASIQSLPTGRAYEKRPRRAKSEGEVERFVAAAFQIDQEAVARAAAVKTIENGTKGPGFAARNRLRPVPQFLLWRSLLETGARFGELTSTAWAGLSESRGTLTLRAANTKSRKERTLPLRRELVDLLRDLRVAHHNRLGRLPAPAERIFLSPSGSPWTENRSYVIKRFRAVLELAAIPIVDARGEKLDVHALRYTCATRLARSGVGHIQAQKLLGHSDPRLTSMIYTHLDSEDLREADESLPALKMARG